MRIFKAFTAALALVGLTACAAPVADVPRGEKVPAAQYLRELSATPYECVDYEAASDTCRFVEQIVRTRGSYYAVGRTRVAEDSDVVLRVKTMMLIEGDHVCFDRENTEFSLIGGSEFMNELLQAEMESAFAEDIFDEALKPCQAYYRNPNGGYLIVDFNGNTGEELGVQFPLFMASPKPLRF
ncbi:hypothetical protein [Aestuariibius sp. HNIBRBA575]|uniref:hypothetical protein n=1 Tax=Aestuariibius sp. HNIBRBA575 TaxID=3233343 RepID=UPI0034A2A379